MLSGLAALLLVSLGLGGCAGVNPNPSATQASDTVQETLTPVPLPASSPAVTSTPTSLSSPTASSSPTGLPTVTNTPAPQICSPLADIPLSNLAGMISNPFNPPPPGSDNPHQAIDLSVLMPGSQVAVSGHPVQSVMSGTVAALIYDRFPYGNAILIESPLEGYPAGGWQPDGIPTPAPTLALHAALTCPTGPDILIPDPARRSLYVLYAHLQQPPVLAHGETVTCGQTIGSVGGTGNALNPHLHVEARAGPSEINLSSMAHYDASASAEEMRNYCLWRISGLFQLVDPNQLLGLVATH